jgi:hypothetical protein
VVDLALSNIDFGVEGKLDMICSLQSIRVAVERQSSGLEVQLQVLFGYIRDRNGEVNEVLLGVAARRALGP